MENRRQFYAFISYKREDEAHAKWLQNQLQNYRIPSRILAQKGPNHPKRLSPVFRDKSNLRPGYLKEELKEALAQSQYLIVICSQNARKFPEYLDLEIRFFLETGHSPDQIIPFIVDTCCEKPELECFPPELQRLNEAYQILGVNLKDSPERTLWGRKNDAFLKIAASILDVQMPKLKNLDKIRRRRYLALGTAAVLCTALGIWRYYDHNIREHYTYFRDRILVNNAAQGIYPLKEEELSQVPRHYRFTTVGGKLRTVELRNYANHLIYPTPDPLNEGASKILYSYTNSGALESAEYYNYQDQLLVCHRFLNGGEKVSRTWGRESSEPCYVPLDQEHAFSPMAYDRTQISKYNQTFEDGRLVRRLFAQGDQYMVTSNVSSTDFTPSDSALFGYAFSYDELGRVEKITYIGSPDGMTTGTVNGVNAVCFRYDDKTGVLTGVTNLDVYGNPVCGAEGWAFREYTLNETGCVVLEEYFDETGAPVMLSEGYAAKRHDYDGPRLIRTTYLDPEGALSDARGYTTEVFTLDSRGAVIQADYQDAEGKPAMSTAEGAYGWREDYSTETDKTITLLDASGRAMPGKQIEGISSGMETLEDGTQRYVQTTRYFGANMDVPEEGCAYQRTEYDPVTAQCFRHSYHSADGSLACGPEGFALRTISYNDLGQLTLLSYYDELEQLIYQFRFTYDYRGYISGGWFMGQEASDVHSGAYGTTFLRDDAGRIIRATSVDEGGNPMMNEAGYAIKDYTYAPCGKFASITCLDSDNLPVLVEGAARTLYSYNDQGRILTVEYLGDDHYKPILHPEEGYSKVEYAYDEWGNLVGAFYFGADGSPLLLEELGYAGIEWVWDENRNLLAICHYGPDGDSFIPIVTNDGYAACFYSYDEAGNITTVQYYRSDGENFIPMNSTVTGYACLDRAFDDRGNMLYVQYYATDGETLFPMNHPEKGYSRIEWDFNEENKITAQRKYGTDGNEQFLIP